MVVVASHHPQKIPMLKTTLYESGVQKSRKKWIIATFWVHVMIVGGFFRRPEASFPTIAPIFYSAKLFILSNFIKEF